MPRKYGRLLVSIWQDKDYQALDPYHQGVYNAFLAYPQISWCGIIDYIPKRLTAFSEAIGPKELGAAVKELASRDFVYLDSETDELLVRTFIRHDGVMNQKNIGKAMVTAMQKVQSEVLVRVIENELVNLYRIAPDLKGWEGFQELAPVLYEDVVWVATNPTPNTSGNPNPNTSPNTSGKG